MTAIATTKRTSQVPIVSILEYSGVHYEMGAQIHFLGEARDLLCKDLLDVFCEIIALSFHLSNEQRILSLPDLLVICDLVHRTP